MLRNVKRSVAKTAIVVAGFALAGTAAGQTMQQAIQHALHTNPDVQRDIANRFTVGEQLKQAKAGWLPVVDLNAGIGRERSNNPTCALINSCPITLTRREASATLTQNLFNGFGTVADVRRQRAHLHSAAFKIVEKAQDVALDTVEKYLDVLRYQHLLQISQQNLNAHERILGMIKQRSETGLGRKADLEQAESRVALARANVVAERGHLRDARTAFIRVVGEEPVNLKWPNSPGSKTLPKSLKQAIALAHHDHPAIKSITADVSATEAKYHVDLAEMFPKLDLVLEGSRNRNLDGIVGNNFDEYVMLRASYNIFRGGEDLARMRESAFRVQEANETRNNVLADADEHVRLTWYGLMAVSNRLVYLNQHRNLAEKTVEAYSEQFKIGKRTLLDLLDAQAEYYNASIDRFNAVHDEVIARYRLLHSIGQLLAYSKVPVPAEATVPEAHFWQLL